MKIVCRNCGRIVPVHKIPHHFVCNCGKTLICFGEQKECELIENGKKFPEYKYSHKNIYKLSYPEKETYFWEKYPSKH